jgi:hypothetical protein
MAGEVLAKEEILVAGGEYIIGGECAAGGVTGGINLVLSNGTEAPLFILLI